MYVKVNLRYFSEIYFIGFILSKLTCKNKTHNQMSIWSISRRRGLLDPVDRALEISCPTCLTRSHFIQDKLKISLYLSLDKCKICIKLMNFVFHILINYYEFTCCIENSVDPDQLASSDLVWIFTIYKRVDICMVSYLFSKV